ncbi:MAG: outer membrane lipoprotein carrier protein LolA [Bacteroidetes bacterium]|nr:outer membrane lipoprotein carrier protein LolA [Bacteroidota bacterium]
MNKQALLLFVSLSCSITLMAQEGFTYLSDPKEVRQKLSKATTNTTTIQSDFEQEKVLDIVSEKMISKGKFYFKKEKKLRWEYTEPFSYAIIINNDKVTIRDGGKSNQVNSQSSRLMKEINGILIGCLKGTLFSNDKEYKSEFYENPKNYLVILQPKSKQLGSYISRIKLYFDRQDLTVSKVEIIEPSNDQTKLVFVNKKINQPIDDGVFNVTDK